MAGSRSVKPVTTNFMPISHFINERNEDIVEWAINNIGTVEIMQVTFAYLEGTFLISAMGIDRTRNRNE